MPALGFLETATNPSVWEADRLFIQMPSVLAGVSQACCHASEGSASPQPLLSLLLFLVSSRDVCMPDVTSAGHHGDIKLSAGHQDAHNQCHPKGDNSSSQIPLYLQFCFKVTWFGPLYTWRSPGRYAPREMVAGDSTAFSYLWIYELSSVKEKILPKPDGMRVSALGITLCPLTCV